MSTLRCADVTIAARKPTASGWNIPKPGTLIWHTPAGRTYNTTPTQYAI